MGNCSSACCHTERPPHKKHVIDIYPKNSSEAQKNHRRFKPLVQFAAEYPNRLPETSRYLAKHIKRDLHRHDASAVETGCGAFLALMDECHSDHAGYDQYVCEIMKLLFEDKSVDSKILGCDMFNKYITLDNLHSGYNNFHSFFKYLVELCTYTKKKKRLEARTAGIKSMVRMVQLNRNEQTLEHLKEVIPAVLDNFCTNLQKEEGKYAGDGKAIDIDEKRKLLDELSRDCLDNITKLATLGNVLKVISPILDYLDKRQWIPLELSITSLTPVVNHANFQIASTSLCDNIDAWSKRGPQSLLIITRIVETIRELVLTIQVGDANGSRVVLKLIEHLSLSVQEDEDCLEIAIIQCIGAYFYQIQNFGDSIEAIQYILEEALGSDCRQRRSLLRAASHIARLLPPFPCQPSNADSFPDSIINILARLLGQAKDTHVKVLANGVLQNLLLPSTLLRFDDDCCPDEVHCSEEFHKISIFLNRINDIDLPVSLTPQQFDWIKQGIYAALREPGGNTGETIQACFRTLVVLLHLGERLDFINQTPMIFSLQELAVNLHPDMAVHALRLHTLVVTHLLFLAQMFSSHNIKDVRLLAELLQQEISNIINEREKSGQIASDLVIDEDVGLNLTNNDGNLDPTQPIEILIDKKEVIEILQQFPAPSMDSSDMRRKLNKKFLEHPSWEISLPASDTTDNSPDDDMDSESTNDQNEHPNYFEYNSLSVSASTHTGPANIMELRTQSMTSDSDGAWSPTQHMQYLPREPSLEGVGIDLHASHQPVLKYSDNVSSAFVANVSYSPKNRSTLEQKYPKLSLIDQIG